MRPFLRVPLAAALVVALPVAGVAAVVYGAAITRAPIQQISIDPFTNSTSQHRTEVEPDVFSYGKTTVAVVQQGRFFDGGASDIGFSTSTDGGKSWRYGSLPGITTIQDPQHGKFARVSDPSIAYDAKHGHWLAASLPLDSNASGEVPIVNGSLDGLHWSSPLEIAANNGDFMDKDWIVCDNNSSSPYFGRCYIEFDDASQGDQIMMSTSSDGGRSWSAPYVVPNAYGLGGQPLAQPSGRAVVPYLDNNGNISAFSSNDGGNSWGTSVLVSNVATHGEGGSLRSQQLPSAEVDGAGTLYVVWQDCSFRANCASNDIVLSGSRDGVHWTSPVRIPIDSTSSTVDHFIPGIAVDPATSGNNAHLGVTFYFYPVSNCSESTCRLGVGYIGSQNGGRTWQQPVLLTSGMHVTWLANTNQGYMVGDYIATTFAASGGHGAFSVAQAPGSQFAQALYTSVNGLSATRGPERTSLGDRRIVGAHSDRPFFGRRTAY